MEINQEPKSIRAFIGAKDYETSRSFYRDLGFTEQVLSEKMSLFTIDGLSFYLQDYYVKDWIDNSMILLEVGDVEEYYRFLQQLELDKRYAGIRLVPLQKHDWGRECCLVDPSGVLWHFADFRR
jgi:uncharacterized glyoxalase superfamily protein PhnB